MNLPDDLLTVFSAEIEGRRDDSPVIDVPSREIEIGSLESGETYQVALISTETSGSGSEASESDEAKHRETDQGSEPPVEEGENLEVEIEDVGEQGDGIARVGPGYIVFISDTDIGDRVMIEVTQARENYAFADVVEEEPVKG